MPGVLQNVQKNINDKKPLIKFGYQQLKDLITSEVQVNY